MSKMTNLKRWFSYLEDINAYIGASSLVLIMVLVSIEVFGRYMRFVIVPGTYDLVELVLGGAGALTLSYVQRRRGHVGIEFLTERLSRKKSEQLSLIVLMMMFLLLSLLTWQTWGGAFYSGQIKEVVFGPTAWQIAPFKFMLVVGLGMIALRCLIQFVEATEFLAGKRVSQESK